MQKSARTSRLAILIFLIVLLATGVSACAPSDPPGTTAPAYLVRYFTDDTEYHSETVPQGSVATLPPTPVKDGFLFAGWAVGSPEGDDFIPESYRDVLDTTIAVYARWKRDAGLMFSFRADAGGYIVEGWSGKNSDVYIPARHFLSSAGDYPVVGIAPYAFSYDSARLNVLTSVVFAPDSAVRYIGQFAFRDQPELSEIVLPSTLRQLHTGAMQGCAALVRVALPDALEIIAESTFADCTSLSEVTVSTEAALQTIGANAFRATALTSLRLPATVSMIGAFAFLNCAELTEVSLPSPHAVWTLTRGIERRTLELTDNIAVELTNTYVAYEWAPQV